MNKPPDDGCCLRDPELGILMRWESQDAYAAWLKDHPDEEPVHGLGQHRIAVQLGGTEYQILYDVDHDKGAPARTILKAARRDLEKHGLKGAMKMVPGSPPAPIELDAGLVGKILHDRGE